MQATYWLVLACGVLALLYGAYAARVVLAADTGTPRMREIAAAVQEGARAYLNRQYTTIAMVGIVIGIILGATLGRALVRGRLARAALDVSDGLLADLGHVCETSGVGAVVEAARLPLSPAAHAALAAAPELIGDALGGGDDYELLFTAEEGALLAIRAAAVAAGVPVTAIGRLTAEPGIRVMDAAGRPVETGRAGWAHF